MEPEAIQYKDRDRPDLGCYVERIEYDFWTRRGILWMAEGNCTDMRGCITLFEAIDPEVVFITTMSGPDLDTRYDKRTGSWKAIPHN